MWDGLSVIENELLISALGNPIGFQSHGRRKFSSNCWRNPDAHNIHAETVFGLLEPSNYAIGFNCLQPPAWHWKTILPFGLVKDGQKAPKRELERGERIMKEYFSARKNGELVHAKRKTH